jgi:acyl carrier protein
MEMKGFDMTVEQRVKKIIAETLECDSDISSQEKLISLGADSLDFLDLPFQIEREFGTSRSNIQFDMNPDVTIQDLIDYVEQEFTSAKLQTT